MSVRSIAFACFAAALTLLGATIRLDATASFDSPTSSIEMGRPNSAPSPHAFPIEDPDPRDSRSSSAGELAPWEATKLDAARAAIEAFDADATSARPQRTKWDRLITTEPSLIVEPFDGSSIEGGLR